MAGASQSAAESPGRGATETGPCPLCSPEETRDSSAAGRGLQCIPAHLLAPVACSPPPPLRVPPPQQGPGIRGGSSLHSSGVQDKYLPNECCLSPAGSVTSPTPAPGSPRCGAHSCFCLVDLDGWWASEPCGSARVPGCARSCVSLGEALLLSDLRSLLCPLLFPGLSSCLKHSQPQMTLRKGSAVRRPLWKYLQRNPWGLDLAAGRL